MDLKIATTISPQGWMQMPSVRAVLDALGQGAALFVGGCVRNALLGVEVADVDIATPLTPPVVMEKLSAAGIRVIPTGIDHGTVTAVVEGTPFEITTLRKDVETDGRRAVVEFTTDWREDAQRRDFTINTLLADADGHVFDPLGTGLADLKARKIAFVGVAAERIAEDALRILRFFRFFVLYGAGAPDGEGLAACKAGAGLIAKLSRERISQEFFKILLVEGPVDILDLMFQNNVLSAFSFVEYKPEILRKLCAFQARYDARALPARLWVLAGFQAQNLKAFEKFVILPKALRRALAAMCEVPQDLDWARDQAVKAALYRWGRESVAQSLLIARALGCAEGGRVEDVRAGEAWEIIHTWDIPKFPVSGTDLMRQGIPAGPALGARLKALEEEWIARGFV